ncbi:MAG TPA: chromate efflux transporter [Rhodospirillales bacterium]|nr:chromate efflux transporter [Rhodospirillales bacterium]
MDESSPAAASGKAAAARPVSLGEAARLWFKVGVLGFGGPAGQIALMHRLIVEEKRWIDEAGFLHALNYCMLLPGPEAQQLAVYIGWLLHRVKGGLIAGLLFIAPGALVMLALSILYVRLGHLNEVQGVLLGVQAAVLAIVVDAMARIGKRALKTPAARAVAAAAFVALFFFAAPFPLVIAAAAVLGFLLKTGEAVATAAGGYGSRASGGFFLRVLTVGMALWAAPTLAAGMLPGLSSTFADIGLFFSKVAVVTFGGAYAVLAYVAQQAVEAYGWLEPGEMITGLGLAETTPGPLIMVVQFVGFLGAYRDPGALSPLIAGILGAALTVWVTFVPCFMWIFLGAPYVERLRGLRRLNAALSMITAAVVGVIANLALWFALHVVFAEIEEHRLGRLQLLVPQPESLNVAAAGLSLAALVAMLVFKTHMLGVLAASALAGLVYALLA